jgi:hypothetical protein
MSLSYDFTDQKILEKFSSAYTLSDMEIFVFPELFFPLVIANIMSPVIWKWREEDWFKGIQKKSFNYKINRIKQYIMDHYVFNLDLETWGLTNKERELSRFRNYIDQDILSRSNALFGYEGDKYYFDIDIRRHFGLDKYDSDIIPYWKTETVEAMTAFRHKESFVTGAGECVSLSALYAAALFIIGRIPLENIFLMGTPLHSQNFVDINEGVLTNNRRIVTKRMWFNGTSISTMARRALEHERVTIVTHTTGYIHQMYDKATINKEAYMNFSEKLRAFLVSPLSSELFLNFLRYHMKFKKYFQYRHYMKARDYYIALETLFEYEHSTKYILSADSVENLLNEIDDEQFSLTPLNDRIVLQEITNCLEQKGEINMDEFMLTCFSLSKSTTKITEDKIKLLLNDLTGFLKVEPRLPDLNKNFIKTQNLKIHPEQTREEIFNLIKEKSVSNETALFSLYAYRQMDLTDWRPFTKAALERNPVSLKGLSGKTASEAYEMIASFDNESIYEECRLSQPDEVWNFRRGDGLEKAFLMANFLYNSLVEPHLILSVKNDEVVLDSGNNKYQFYSVKGLVNELKIEKEKFN